MKQDMASGDIDGYSIRFAVEEDITLILEFIKQLAAYEKLSHEVVAIPENLRKHLFGEQPKAEVLIGEFKGEPVSFALFFHNFSTFLGKPGIYLEDLFVKTEARGRGFGKGMLACLARLALERDCGRLEWWVLDWNEQAIQFYEALGAEPMDEWTTYRMTGDRLKDLAGGY